MARPLTPIAIADLKGSSRKNPARYKSRKNAPQPLNGVGSPPPWLSQGAAQAWTEIAMSLPASVLTSADRLALELASELICEFREAPRAFTAARTAQLRGLLGSLGLTPVDRIKLAVPEIIEENDPWLLLSRS